MARRKTARRPRVKIAGGNFTQENIDYTGFCPTWSDMAKLSPEEHYRRWQDGKRFYYIHFNTKELLAAIPEIFSKDWTDEQKEVFGTFTKWEVSPYVGAMCKMIQDGAYWWPDSKVWANVQIEKAFAKTVANRATEEVKGKKKETVQDRLNEIRSNIIADFNEFEDQLMVSGQLPTVNVLNFLRDKNVPQNIIGSIEDEFGERMAFLMEAHEGEDPQLVEGYSHYKKKDWKNWITWYNNILTDLSDYKRMKVNVKRKTRVKKPVSPDKLVRRLKYMRTFEDLGLTSIQPTELVQSQQAWIYNTKTRKLFKYIASDSDQVLTVKGTTLIGWDPKVSVGKTLRKPKEQLAAFYNAGKVQLRTFLDDIRATEVKGNGRINEHTILLKAFK